jgi:hypothetical protein
VRIHLRICSEASLRPSSSRQTALEARDAVALSPTQRGLYATPRERRSVSRGDRSSSPSRRLTHRPSQISGNSPRRSSRTLSRRASRPVSTRASRPPSAPRTCAAPAPLPPPAKPPTARTGTGTRRTRSPPRRPPPSDRPTHTLPARPRTTGRCCAPCTPLSFAASGRAGWPSSRRTR